MCRFTWLLHFDISDLTVIFCWMFVLCDKNGENFGGSIVCLEFVCVFVFCFLFLFG